MKKQHRTIRNRIWLFALLAVLATILLGSAVNRGERHEITATALTLAEQSAGDDRSTGKELAWNRPGVLLRANTSSH